MLRLTLVLAVLVLLSPATASGATAQRPWPPAGGAGDLFVHFGEEHVNDDDGPTILPSVVDSVAAYAPRLVTMSGDKANDGEADQLQQWQDVMARFDRAGVPYLAGMGNHDRNAPPGAPGGTIGLFGGTTPDSIEPYRSFFAARPYPWGDGKPYDGIGSARPADDPEGASTHYTADTGQVRWIFLDNSCFTLTGCDPFQQTSDDSTASQFDYLRAKAEEGTKAGKLVFVVMHMPTRDPRDQSYTDETARNHVMGKGATTDNATFEDIAAATGVDGVFLGHIKGQFTYRGKGGVPYFIDGGAGGELYTTGPVGTDHGYWHGYRLLRVVDGELVTTDTVPVFVPDGLTLSGPDRLAAGEQAHFTAAGRQPVFKDPAKVEALELRDPDPVRPASRSFLGQFAWVQWGGPVLLVGGLLMLTVPAPRRRRIAAAGGGLAVVLAGGVAVAQQSTPTTTPKDSLPVPARIFETGDASVLAPVASADDDPRRDVATQTEDGTFVARCPGRTTVRVTSGWETTTHAVTVPSRAGTIARDVRRGPTVMRRGRRATIATVRLAQPARVRIRVQRGSRVVRELVARCAGAGTVRASWDGRGAARGRYTVKTAVLSDRAPLRRTSRLRLR